MGSHDLLPMYLWPETKGQTDALCRAVQQTIRQSVERLGDQAERVWFQSCGLPVALGEHVNALPVATLAFDVPGCEAGRYCSRIIAKYADVMEQDARLRLAINGRASQSGHAALLGWLRACDIAEDRIAHVLWTGSHRASIQAVAVGDADLAAIDAVSFALAKYNEPAAKTVTVLQSTPPTPGLPILLEKSAPISAERFRSVLRNAIALVDHDPMIVGVHAVELRDYLPLGRQFHMLIKAYPITT